MTYIDQLLGPVLVIAGRNDPGCSIRQVRRYVTAALGAGKEITLHECNMGHGTADRNKQIRHQAISISFLDRIMRQV
jgi:dipeptidyl aminopeptidase/acylaminoacyl peptidase